MFCMGGRELGYTIHFSGYSCDVCAADVYERLTAPGKKPSLMTLVITQAVSGLWHGVFAGYALMFISCAFFFHSSKVRTCSNPNVSV